jgi:hypothetical protein
MRRCGIDTGFGPCENPVLVDDAKHAYTMPCDSCGLYFEAFPEAAEFFDEDY